MDVAQVGNPIDDALFLGQQGGGQDRQSGVFGTSDADFTLQASASVNENLIHNAFLFS